MLEFTSNVIAINICIDVFYPFIFIAICRAFHDMSNGAHVDLIYGRHTNKHKEENDNINFDST